MTKNQVITFTLFRFRGLRHRWWALSRMGLSPWMLRNVAGMQFGKMLGSGGGNGFSAFPNFGVYGFLGVWEDLKSAQAFFAAHPFFVKTTQHAEEYWTIFMHVYASHGKWNGQEPFQLYPPPDENTPIAVLTRATIRPQRLLHFWRHVAAVSHAVDTHSGKIFSIGIGELPVIQQVTFSLWKNSAAMKNYAYHSASHSKVVRYTHQYQWFQESLFARLTPFATEGTWNGSNPLENYLDPNSSVLLSSFNCK